MIKTIQGHQQKLKNYFIDDGICDFDKDYEGEEQDISHSYSVSHEDIENYDQEFLQHWKKKLKNTNHIKVTWI